MGLLKNINADLNANYRFAGANKILLFFANRGFHAVLFYRLAHILVKARIPVLPVILSRIVQIFYAIDIDPEATISGGVVIVHGVGTVIGAGCKIGKGVIIFHGVTLGRRGVGPVMAENDGYPEVKDGVIICAGAKLLGNITIGQNAVVGANVVVSKSVNDNHTVKIDSQNFISYPNKPSQWNLNQNLASSVR